MLIQICNKTTWRQPTIKHGSCSTMHRHNASLMLGHCLRPWPNNKPPLGDVSFGVTTYQVPPQRRVCPGTENRSCSACAEALLTKMPNMSWHLLARQWNIVRSKSWLGELLLFKQAVLNYLVEVRKIDFIFLGGSNHWQINTLLLVLWWELVLVILTF